MSRNDDTFMSFKGGIKKMIVCKFCGKRLEVKNFNRLLCTKCGYREHRKCAKR